MPSTTINAYPYPSSSDNANVPSDIQALANRAEALTGDREYAQVLTSQSTSSTTVTDLATVGPTVTLEVPANGLVALLAEVTLTPSGASTGFVYLQEPTDFSAGIQIINATAGTRQSLPGSSSGQGAGSIPGGPILLRATAGTRTYKLRYAMAPGGTSMAFSARKLWAWVLPFP